MIYIIITSFNEPNSTIKAVKKILVQNIKEDYQILVVDPFPEIEEKVLNAINDERVQFYLDPGEGKNYALNMLFQDYFSENPDHLFIFTDGDVYVSDNAINEIIAKFKDKKVGAVTGRPVSIDTRDNMMGYWSKVLYNAIHKVRMQKQKKGEFFQCSGYLFAVRNSIIREIPPDVPEDAIIPYYVWKKDYRVAYADKAEVFVKYPSNWKDWVNQRVRTIKAHENISKLFPDMPRTKSFFNEFRAGVFYAIRQPRTPRELLWTLNLYMARLYIYYQSYRDMRKKKIFNPAWRDEEVQSTKMLD